MPINTEITVDLTDQPGTLANLCQGLANRGINIMGIQAAPGQGKGSVRLVVDDPSAAGTVLSNQNMRYTETKIVQAALSNRPGELARAATRLGEAKININHMYCGLDSKTNEPLLFFGVDDTGRAATILSESAAKTATTSR